MKLSFIMMYIYEGEGREREGVETRIVDLHNRLGATLCPVRPVSGHSVSVRFDLWTDKEGLVRLD